MKVLFVSAVFPYPLVSGGQVRIYQLLKHVSRFHEIHLASFVRSDRESEYASQLPFVKSVWTILRGRAIQPKYIVRSLSTSDSLLFTSYRNVSMRMCIGNIIRDAGIELIHIEPGYVYPSVPDVRVPIVCSEHNIEHEVYKKFSQRTVSSLIRGVYAHDVKKMEKNERDVWKHVSAVTAVSESDAEDITRITGRPTPVINNGVDIEQYAFRPKSRINRNAPEFLYVGTFRWIQNIDAAEYLIRTVWPTVKRIYPKSTLRIIGSDPPKRIRALCTGDIRLDGYVKSMSDAYARADVLLAPIRVAGGSQYKIIESMASGLPVVTTSLGVAGLGGNPVSTVWVADSLHEIGQAVSDIINGKGVEQKLASARKLIEQQYAWPIIARKLDQVWRNTHEKAA